MSSIEPMLRMHSLVFGYWGRPLARPVTLTVQAGQLLLVTGRNGAGKSTLLRVLGGRLPALQGRVTLGEAPIPQAPHRARAAGVAWSAQRPRVVGSLCVHDNLMLGRRTSAAACLAGLWGGDPLPSPEATEPILERLGCAGMAARLGSELSVGQRRVLENARALLADDARLLLFDEPFANLREDLIGPFLDMLREVLERCGAVAVVVEHRRLDRVPHDALLDLDGYGLDAAAQT